MLRVHALSTGLVIQNDSAFLRPGRTLTLDEIFGAPDPVAFVRAALTGASPCPAPIASALRAPLQSQEIWAAGVTYLRSKTARMAESKDSGGGTFYDKVYEADRPELFFKATPHRVVAPGNAVRIRADSKWNVPEPELALVVSSRGRITGYTVGNDMSSRDIEGANPLYLPQAKV
ncbi:MAG: fumarylacetoacetate hydrolase family protein, partial [Opitutaceae bacterium]